MGKMLNVRLDDETHRKVARIARASRRSKSQVVREAIAEYASGRDSERTAYDVWKDVIGIAQGLPDDLSRRTGDRLARMLTQDRRRKRKP
jgi:predicted transcriptional regulator